MHLAAATGLQFAPKRNPVWDRDRFNRADGALGNTEHGRTWEAIAGGFTIVGNEVVNSTVVAGYNVAAVEEFLSNCIPGVRVKSNVTLSCRLCVRLVDANNFLFLIADFTAANYKFYKLVAGAPTLVQTIATAPALNDYMQVKLNGTNLTVIINGVVAASIVEAANLAGTKHGIATHNTFPGGKWDDFQVLPL